MKGYRNMKRITRKCCASYCCVSRIYSSRLERMSYTFLVDLGKPIIAGQCVACARSSCVLVGAKVVFFSATSYSS